MAYYAGPRMPVSSEEILARSRSTSTSSRSELQASIFMLVKDGKILASGTLECVQQHLAMIFTAASQSKRAKRKNKIKRPQQFALVIIAQLSNFYSKDCLGFQAVHAFAQWASGSSRQMIDSLKKLSLSISYDSTLKLVERLADRSIEEARAIAQGPHMLAYDNINISTSIHVEQREDAPAKVQSGTLPLIYQLRNGSSGAMSLSDEQLSSILHQFKVEIVRCLLKNSPFFEKYRFRDNKQLCHRERHPMKKGHKTCFCPLRISTIQENTIDGTIQVLNDVYFNQLDLEFSDKINDLLAIPCVNDQLTNALIRAAKQIRRGDVTPWTRLDLFQLAFGIFHLQLNLVWALLCVHRGTVNQVGSLSWFFAILDRTRLGSEHPNYYTLRSALMQILNGLILNAWELECGSSSLDAFARSTPSPSSLLNVAAKILSKHASPVYDAGTGKASTNDIVNQNVKLLTRDLLYVFALDKAVSDGDFGRIEDMLGHLAMIFRGAGSNKYSMEIIYFLHNIKLVWTPEFADVMRDNMLINISGQEGCNEGVDMNIEHVIRNVKMVAVNKGVYGSWDRIANTSATDTYSQGVKKQFTKELGSAHRGNRHITPDIKPSIFKVAAKAKEHQLQTCLQDTRPSTKPTVDTLLAGDKKLRSSTITNFNKKIKDMVAGRAMDEDEDEIPTCEVECGAEEEPTD